MKTTLMASALALSLAPAWAQTTIPQPSAPNVPPEAAPSERDTISKEMPAAPLSKSDKKAIDDFVRFNQNNVMEDKDGNLVYLAQSEWFLNTEKQNNPDITFHETSEFKTAG